MKVIKRDGHMVDFCPDKIEAAIEKANASVDEDKRVSPIQIRNIIKYVETRDKKRILVEDIQDIIEMKLMAIGKYEVAKKYCTQPVSGSTPSGWTQLGLRLLLHD